MNMTDHGQGLRASQLADRHSWRAARRFQTFAGHRLQTSRLSCFTRSLTGFGLIRLEQNWALENMADGSEKLLAKLAALDDSLDDLEEKLEPLLAQTLPESLLPLDTIQQVKLNVAIPYLVYDLIFSTPQSTTTLSKLQTNALDNR